MLTCECASRRDGFMEDRLSGLWVHVGCGLPRPLYLLAEAPHLVVEH